LKFRQYPVNLMPLLKKLSEARPQALGVQSRHDGRDVEPGLVQFHLTNEQRSKVDKTADDGSTRVHRAVTDQDLKIVEDFRHSQHARGAINLKSDLVPRQLQRCALKFQAMAVLEKHKSIL